MHKALEAAHKKILQNSTVYAATTIHLNDTLNQQRDRMQTSEQACNSSRAFLKELFLRCDRAFHGTPDVIERISSRDRFHCFVTVEKPGTSTHMHMAWYSPHPTEYENKQRKLCSSAPWNALLRRTSNWRYLQFILSVFNNSTQALSESDRAFLTRMASVGSSVATAKHVRSMLAICSVFSTSVYDQEGLLGYDTKERYLNPDFTDQIFFADDFFGSDQRTKPTRYFSYSGRDKRVKMLNLDVPLRPRK